MKSTSKTVSFTSMKEGTRDDFLLIAANDKQTDLDLPERILDHLKEMAKDDGAYRISRLDHVLQCATRAYRDGADEDWVVAALIHDIGDTLAPFTHGHLAYEVIRPFVREEVAWVIRHHGTFQMHYNKSLTEELRKSREKYEGHPWYQLAVDFCENWDQCSFDPAYDTEELSFFEPMIKSVFLRKPFCR